MGRKSMYTNKYKRIDAGTVAKLLILAEMLYAADNPLPMEEEEEEEEEDEN
jgi:hypothetical protein